VLNKSFVMQFKYSNINIINSNLVKFHNSGDRTISVKARLYFATDGERMDEECMNVKVEQIEEVQVIYTDKGGVLSDPLLLRCNT